MSELLMGETRRRHRSPRRTQHGRLLHTGLSATAGTVFMQMCKEKEIEPLSVLNVVDRIKKGKKMDKIESKDKIEVEK
jgi:hypothetical protein